MRAEAAAVVREGYGTGEGQGSSLGEVHERALKMAETDATKRALATFGKPFGLALYVSGRNGRGRTPPTVPTTGAGASDDGRRRTLQRMGSNGRFYVPARRTAVLDPAFTLAVSATAPSEASVAPEARLLSTANQSAGSTASPRNRTEEDEHQGAVQAMPEVPTQSPAEQQGNDAVSISPTGDAPPGEPSPQSKAESFADQASPGTDARPSHQLLIERPRRRREPAHLRFVMSQPCLLCGRSPSDAHHLRFAQPRALGRKVSDEFTVPLCRTHHRQLHHSGNEAAWWQAADRDVDPLEIAKGLWEQSLNGGSSRNK